MPNWAVQDVATGQMQLAVVIVAAEMRGTSGGSIHLRAQAGCQHQDLQECRHMHHAGHPEHDGQR